MNFTVSRYSSCSSYFELLCCFHCLLLVRKGFHFLITMQVKVQVEMDMFSFLS
jgi:hypothetical protein